MEWHWFLELHLAWGPLALTSAEQGDLLHAEEQLGLIRAEQQGVDWGVGLMQQVELLEVLQEVQMEQLLEEQQEELLEGQVDSPLLQAQTQLLVQLRTQLD